MNEKDFELDRIVSVVIDCTKSNIWSDNSITKEELLGKSKNENACMARAILVSQLVKTGFTISTISGLLRRTAQGKIWIYMCAMHTNSKTYEKH